MRIIVTGVNSGVGKATATAMAAAGHQVVIACRTLPKGHAAAAAMPGDVEVAELDLADLASVRRFADTVDSVDVLVNNAGVLGLPLTRTADGFEAHMGTNHLGHFALTCLLGDRIRDRVVAVSSTNYNTGQIHFDDLNCQQGKYNPWAAYGDSKLANLLMVRALVARGKNAFASDPGMTAIDTTRDGSGAMQWAGRVLSPYIAQSPANGARSTVQAITTNLPNVTYLSPRGLMHQWGQAQADQTEGQGRERRRRTTTMGTVRRPDRLRMAGQLVTADTGYHRPGLRLPPSPTAESRAFWTGGQNGELLINRCHGCGHFFHPPGAACWRCRSTDVAPEPVSGEATVAAFTVNRQTWIPGFEPPYVVAMVELADEPDVRLITNVVGVPVEDVHVGMAVEVFFEDWTSPSGDEGSRVWLPLFRPAEAAHN